MEKKKFGGGGIAAYLLFCAIVVALVMLCICHSGCQITTEGIKVLGAEESPEIEALTVINERAIEVQFNKEIRVKSARLSQLLPGEKASFDLAAENIINAKGVPKNDSKTIVYNFEKSTTIGQRYQLFSEIEDSRGNTLTFAVPFEACNTRIPILILAEIQGGDNNASNFRGQYIMLRALTDGNLAGLELFNASQEKLSDYAFPAVEVKAGEYITIHLRAFENESRSDELGTDLTKDTSAANRNYIRDLHYDFQGNCLKKEYGIVFLRNRTTMEILDAVLYLNPTEKNKSAYLKYLESAKLAVEQKKWKSVSSDCTPCLLTGNLSAVKSCLQRKNCDALLSLAKQNKITQKDIIGSTNDWEDGKPTLYNSSR